MHSVRRDRSGKHSFLMSFYSEVSCLGEGHIVWMLQQHHGSSATVRHLLPIPALLRLQLDLFLSRELPYEAYLHAWFKPLQQRICHRHTFRPLQLDFWTIISQRYSHGSFPHMTARSKRECRALSNNYTYRKTVLVVIISGAVLQIGWKAVKGI